jgi:competence protein ComEC
VLAACAFAGGVLLSRVVWLVPGYLLVLLAALFLLAAMTACFAPRLIPVVLSLLCVVLGLFCALAEARPLPDVQIQNMRDGLLRGVEGTLVAVGPLKEQNMSGADEQPEVRLSRTLDLVVSRVERVSDNEDVWQSAHGKVRVTLTTKPGETLPLLPCGEQMTLDVRLLAPRVFHDPGLWSRAEWLSAQGIDAEATLPVERIRQRSAPQKTTLACLLTAWQHRTSERILALASETGNRIPALLRLSAEDAAMLSAMLTGDRTHLAAPVRVGFERTGCFHLLVVSGLHVAILSGFVYWLLRRFKAGRAWASLLAMGFAAIFALFCGFGEPVQRSLLMLVLLYAGQIFFRERSALNVIGFAVLGMLAIHPAALFDAGFQMTLLSVVAAGGLAQPLLRATILPYHHAMVRLRMIELDPQLTPRIAQFRLLLRIRLETIESFVGGWIAWRVLPLLLRFCCAAAELMVLSLTIELVLALPMAVYFHRITLAALPANLLLLPVAGVLLPLALLLTPLSLVLLLDVARWVIAPLALVLHGVELLVASIAAWKVADWRVPGPLLWQIVVSMMLLALSVWLVRGGRIERWVGVLVLAMSTGIALWPPPLIHADHALELEAIDVGQGDSLLVISPNGKTLLVDGGGVGGRPYVTQRSTQSGFDIGEEVVSETLWARGVRRLDAVALSHAHSDHLDGLFAVLRNFHPQELWVGKNPGSAEYLRLLAEAKELGIPVRFYAAGMEFAFGGSRVRALAPPANYVPGESATNNDSLVLRIASGDGSSLLLEGDAETAPEEGMVAAGGLSSTLLKVGHHGSLTSTTPEFLSAVHPKVAMISVGRNNHYEHPRTEVLERLGEAGVRTYRTDLDGAVCFRLMRSQIEVNAGCSGW